MSVGAHFLRGGGAGVICHSQTLLEVLHRIIAWLICCVLWCGLCGMGNSVFYVLYDSMVHT